MIVVSNERENEFEQERENESSENAKDITPSHKVDFIRS